MEDIDFLHTFFNRLEIIVCSFFGVTILSCLFEFLVSVDFNLLLFSLLDLFVFFIGWYILKIARMILTRFVAMTENIYEITEMLEKKTEKTTKS